MFLTTRRRLRSSSSSRSWSTTSRRKRNIILAIVIVGLLILNGVGTTFVWNKQKIVIFQDTIFGGVGVGGGGGGDDNGSNNTTTSSSKLMLVDSSSTTTTRIDSPMNDVLPPLRPMLTRTILPTNTTITIAIRLRGQMGNILSGIAFGMGVQLWIRDRYNLSSSSLSLSSTSTTSNDSNNNIRLVLLPDPKYVGARKKVLQCFPKLSELFTEQLQPPNKLSSQYKKIHAEFTTRYKQQTKLLIDSLILLEEKKRRKSNSTRSTSTTGGEVVREDDIEIATAAKAEANKIQERISKLYGQQRRSVISNNRQQQGGIDDIDGDGDGADDGGGAEGDVGGFINYIESTNDIDDALDAFVELVNIITTTSSSDDLQQDQQQDQLIQIPLLLSKSMYFYIMIDKYYDEIIPYFTFDSKSCCSNTLPKPNDSVFHFRNYKTELKFDDNTTNLSHGGCQELPPYVVANKLFRNLQQQSTGSSSNIVSSSSFDSVAMTSRYPDSIETKQYITALADQRGIPTRIIQNHTAVEDFCFLLHTQKELVGIASSTYLKWAAILNPYHYVKCRFYIYDTKLTKLKFGTTASTGSSSTDPTTSMNYRRLYYNFTNPKLASKITFERYTSDDYYDPI